MWAAIGTDIVSQNISLFCAAAGLGMRPRASMSKEKIKELLKLSDTQYPLLNHPVGHLKWGAVERPPQLEEDSAGISFP